MKIRKQKLSEDFVYGTPTIGKKGTLSQSLFSTPVKKKRTISKDFQTKKLSYDRRVSGTAKLNSKRQPSISSLTKGLEKTGEKKAPKKARRIISKQRRSMPNLDLKHGSSNSVSRCAYKTRVGSMMGKSKRYNQDALLVQANVAELKTQYIFAVLDGHGNFGHLVSNYVKSNVGKNIEECLRSYASDDLDVLSFAIKKGIQKTEISMREVPFDTALSGTTMVLTLIRDGTLICANLGDSRAVLGKCIAGQWTAVDLTNDHKPDLPEEKKRILETGGRVQPVLGERNEPIGPERVWLAQQHIPGLAMSRSLGDDIAHSVGVSSDPEITKFQISSEDKFLVLATDGIWEFITSQEVVTVIGNLIDIDRADSACNILVKEAVSRWNAEDHSVDDITVIIIFLSGYK